MIFHENRLLVDDSHEISYLFSFRNLEKMSQHLSSAAVLMGSLRFNCPYYVNSFLYNIPGLCLLFKLFYDQEIPQSLNAGGPMTL